jgi:hypothetical protein
MIYLYGIADRPRASPGERAGLREGALEEIVCCDIAAIVSVFDGAAVSTAADEVWRHEEILESLMEERTVLPARFGTLLPSAEYVGEILRRAYGALVRDIARVRGQVEIGLRFLGASEDSAADGALPAFSNDAVGSAANPGSAYLRMRVVRERARRSRLQGRAAIIRGIYERIARHATEARLDDAPDDLRGMSAAFLVRRDGAASFRTIVGRAAAANPELTMLCTGPWPPYSFVDSCGPPTCSGEKRHAS